MNAFAVTYSYPTVDRYYRGQRTTRVLAVDARVAGRKALKVAPQGSTLVRVRASVAS